jgi:hypothetical protein
MAENEEWVERNFKQTIHGDRETGDTAEDQRILPCLGASVILHWKNLPKKFQKELFDSAGAKGDLLKTKALRAQIACFPHEHKNDRSET